MEKVIRFNPLNDDITFDTVMTDWKVVSEFYTSTNVGPLLTGLLWKDTENNRALIGWIIQCKVERKKLDNEIVSRIHKLVNQKEK